MDIKLMQPSFAPWAPKKSVSKQIAVLMSGGVDSSVTAHLLKKAGWEVLGITMKVPVACDTGKLECCGTDAAFVCNELEIPHYFVNVIEVFEKLIIEPFRRAYTAGQTPNPCVDCNTILKLSLVWDLITETFGINYVATGHYARVHKTKSGAFLSRAINKAKDQSYFLYGILLQKLPYFILPLGELTKQQVRSIATDLGLTIANKPESMELCFAEEGNYRSALTDTQTNKPGDITNMQGSKIGTHKGIANYTLGQRKGIGFAGGVPLYVGKIDPKNNIITLGTKDEVNSNTITADKINTLIPDDLIKDKNIFGKIRSYSDPQPCKLIDVSKTKITVEFDQPQFAPCPGQRIVLYNTDDNVIAGGTII